MDVERPEFAEETEGQSLVLRSGAEDAITVFANHRELSLPGS
jgi:hypothetical protein